MDRLTPRWGSGRPVSKKASEPADAKAAAGPPAGDKPKRDAPFSLRLSFDERRRLEAMAGRQSLSAYIKARLFDPDAPVKAARGLNPVKDQEALGQVLALLGAAGLASNIAEMANAARVGALPLDPESQSALRRACDDIQVMRRFLMAALGIRERQTDPHVCESCRSVFTRAADRGAGDALEREPAP
ncbi:MAG: hypothetical protein ACFB2Z_00300 [Maricaulaceae bacterium]